MIEPRKPMDPELYQVVLECASNQTEAAAFLEIGTYTGASAIDIMLAIYNSRRDRWLFTVDPYGEKTYRQGNYVFNYPERDYGERIYRTAMRDLHSLAADLNIRYAHWRMASVDFMRVIDTIGFWYNGQRSGDSRLGFAYLDGEHVTEVVTSEFNWCWGKLCPGGIIAIDNIDDLGDRDYINRLANLYGSCAPEVEMPLHEGRAPRAYMRRAS